MRKKDNCFSLNFNLKIRGLKELKAYLGNSLFFGLKSLL